MSKQSSKVAVKPVSKLVNSKKNKRSNIEDVDEDLTDIDVDKRSYLISPDLVKLREVIIDDLVNLIHIDTFYKGSSKMELVKNTVGVKCGKCGSEEVNAFSKQIRAGDEATTVFYTCLKCGCRWRVG